VNPLAAGTPPSNLAEARALITRLQSDLQAQQRSMRAPPPEPTTCCGRGCNGCVWEGYYAALAFWQEDALAALAALPAQAGPSA
jgi:hypothetical protein